MIVDWVQEGFQDFFEALDAHFLLLSGRNSSAAHDHGSIDGTQGDRVFAGLVLVLAQLSLFVEQTAIPRITEARRQLMLLFLVPLKVSIILDFLFPKSLGRPFEVLYSIWQEVAASFSGGGVRVYELGPAFVPGEICRIFHSAGEKFLHLV